MLCPPPSILRTSVRWCVFVWWLGMWAVDWAHIAGKTTCLHFLPLQSPICEREIPQYHLTASSWVLTGMNRILTRGTTEYVLCKCYSSRSRDHRYDQPVISLLGKLHGLPLPTIYRFPGFRGWNTWSFPAWPHFTSIVTPCPDSPNPLILLWLNNAAFLEMHHARNSVLLSEWLPFPGIILLLYLLCAHSFFMIQPKMLPHMKTEWIFPSMYLCSVLDRSIL